MKEIVVSKGGERVRMVTCATRGFRQTALCLTVSLCHQHSGAYSFSAPYASHRHQSPFESWCKQLSGLRRKRSIAGIQTGSSDKSSSHQSSAEDTLDKNEWKVGNVYDDLDSLRREIALSQADQHLRQVEDRERLDTFAAQRRPIQHDVRRFIFAPLAFSTLLTIMAKSRRFEIISRSVTLAMDVHLWAVVVVAPMLLLLAKLKSMPPPTPPPTDLKGLDPDYYRFIVTDWEDPKTSCRDHVLCLLENWTSAVVGPALLACLTCLLSISQKRYSHVQVGVGMSQMVTRLGAIASLHQYPRLLFLLKRRHQPRPMDRYTMRLQQLASLALTLASIGIASDLSKVMTQLPSQLLVSLFALGGAAYSKYHLVRGGGRPLTRRTAMQEAFRKTVLSGAQLYSLWNLADMLRRWQPWQKPPSRMLLATTGVCFSLLIGSLYHLLAVQRLVRGSYNHDLSLANDYETISTLLSDPIERQKRFKWRYRLEWREPPERILQTLSKWKDGLMYWYLFQGGVEDQLRKEFQTSQKSAAYRQGLTVLQQCQEEIRKNPNAPSPDSRLWKRNAMERLAARHEQDYKSKILEDPLGIAVQQAFGIGLGYQFDHMTDLREGESPSARRLQARAAKSAIRRAQEIYDADAAREELDSIQDPTERSRRQASMRQAAQAEMDYIASALSELIPTDSLVATERRTTRIQPFRKKYKRSSNHEIIIDWPNEEGSPSVDSLLERQDDAMPDDEFVKEWFRRQQQEDDDDSTVLV